MTIRLEKTNGTTYANSRGVRLVIQSTVAVDTEAEALEAKRAFENVLLPRFTRDEAIALVKTALKTDDYADYPEWLSGVRQTLEALAAAGVFVDSDPCPWCAANREVTPDPGASCETCDGSGRLRTMADKLDAAGIR